MAHLGFDATQVPPDTGQLDPVPAGWYIVMVDDAELKPTGDGTGARLAVRFNIADGQFANRKIYTGFNIRNASPIAQEIAFKQLSALAHSIGVLQVQDTEQLKGIPLKIRVKIKPAKDGYDAQNEVTAFRDINFNPDDKNSASTPAAPGAPVPPVGAPVPPAAAGAPAAPGTGWGGAAPTQPWAQPAAPAAPAPPAAPPAFAPAPPAPPAAAWPPEGWLVHPTAAGYFYKGNEVRSEAELRAMMTPAAPAAPAIPAAPAVPAGPDPAAVAGAAVPPWQQPKAS